MESNREDKDSPGMLGAAFDYFGYNYSNANFIFPKCQSPRYRILKKVYRYSHKKHVSVIFRLLFRFLDTAINSMKIFKFNILSFFVLSTFFSIRKLSLMSIWVQ